MSFEETLAALTGAVGHAERLGLEAESKRGREILAEVDDRMGLTGAIYTLALVGGTGVGKSSLLNAMGAGDISEASVLRPTTHSPMAWAHRDDLADLQPLLTWLDFQDVVIHDSELFRGVAVIDMPDFDSVVTEHRITVDRLLPRLDALLWVVDPQKYDDERLYEYLRPRGERKAVVEVVLNKIDLLSQAEVSQVSDDLRRRLDDAGVDIVGLHAISARESPGVDGLVDAISSRAEAKQIVMAKLGDDMRVAIAGIAEAAGATERITDHATDELAASRGKVTAAVLDVIDLDGLSRQVANAYMSRSRFVAGSVLARVAGIFRVLGGSRRRTADPVRFLQTWRSRGDLSRAANALRSLYVGATANVPAQLRAGVLGRVDPGAVKRSLAESVDDAVLEVSRDFDVATPWTWRLLAAIQIVALVGVVAALLWFATLWFGPADLLVGTVEVWVFGPVPTPLALLLGSLVVSLAVGGLARADAYWRGRRSARKADLALRHAVDREIYEHALSRLVDLDESRAALSSIYLASRATV